MKEKAIVDRICECIKDKIVTKEMFPGYRIVEDELATELGVSRTPLRRALTMLQHEGYLYIVPNRGTYVARYTSEDIAKIYATRICLEEGLAPDMIRLATEEDIADLKKIHRKISEEIHTMTPAEYSIQNKEFHVRLISISDNDYLKRFAYEIYNRISLLLIYYDNASNSVDSILRHGQMIKALEEKDLNSLLSAIRSDSQLANYQ